LEEAPVREPSGPSRPYQILTVSARSSAALDQAVANLTDHLTGNPDLNLADVCFSQARRRGFPHRQALVVETGDTAGAAMALRTGDAQRVMKKVVESAERPVLFMFSGQGSQYVDMARGLYDCEPTFKTTVDSCCEMLRPNLGFDLREILYPTSENKEQSAARLQRTVATQPALFVVEYAMARLWMEFGIEPKGMIGHSIGEYVAACLAGVFSLEDALKLVAARGRLMNEMPTGSMLAAPLSELQARSYVNTEISLAAVNAPGLSVFAGPTPAIASLSALLSTQGIQARKLHTSHAFHSSMMDPVIQTFVQLVRNASLKAPKIPYLSNLTGTWMTPEAALDPVYWGRHLRETVRFGDGLAEVMKYPEVILLEVGPGQTLSTLARQQPPSNAAPYVILSSLRSPNDSQSDEAFLLNTFANAWLNGAAVSWDGLYSHEKRRRLPLPTYPFERKSYWIGPLEGQGASGNTPEKARDVTNWFYTPKWEKRPQKVRSDREQSRRWLILSDGAELGARVRETLLNFGEDIWSVVAGDRFAALGNRSYTVRPAETADYERLIKELLAEGAPDCILHLWTAPTSADVFETQQTSGFFSLISLAQALEKNNVTSRIQVGVVSSQLHDVGEADTLCPSKNTILGPCKVLPQEYPNLHVRSIDIGDWAGQGVDTVQSILAECDPDSFDSVIAYRNGVRWVQEFQPTPFSEASTPSRLRQGGVYLITGGLGNIGLEFAEALSQRVQAKLVLIGRSEFPDRSTWNERLASHPEDATNRKIHRLQKLEAAGSEVLVLRADSADREQMAKAVSDAYERFGVVHGVIHGAGNTTGGGFTNTGNTDRAGAYEHFRPKAQGLQVLKEIFKDRELDFVFLLSSLSAVLGGLGLLSYSAGNIFLDAFAAQENKSGRTPWITVNWDAWQFPGQEREFRASAPQGTDFLYPAEGVECLYRILEQGPGQTVVSTGDLKARIDKWIRLESIRSKPAAKEPQSGSMHERPNLSSQFVAPRTEVERTIADIWQQILGIAPIGVYDKFFELGGHSLLAIQLISRMRDAFHVELSAQRLFEAPTIAQLSATIEADMKAMRRAEAEEEARTEEMLRMVEGLSDEEVAALLAKQDESAA
jgi:acyl transferase domain-containing protein/acyl carrier protein